MKHDSFDTLYEQAHIDLSDEAQVAEWATEFDVTNDQIRSAVAAVGNRPSRVRSHLQALR